VKPSERIKAETQAFLDQTYPPPHSAEQVTRALFRHMLQHADEVEERLAKLERRTSSTEPVTLHEELRDLGNGIREGRTLRVTWATPYGEEPPFKARTTSGQTVHGLVRGLTPAEEAFVKANPDAPFPDAAQLAGYEPEPAEDPE
jgi:hypothetical protein